MLKFSYYIEDKIDKAWFESSNIVYGECDESDTQYKTVRIVFKNGSTYQYENVLVADWTSFKHADSQGKSFIEHFKKQGYKYERIADANLEALEEEYNQRCGYDFLFKVDIVNNSLEVFDNKEKLIYSMNYPGEEITNNFKELLEKIDYKIRIQNKD